VRVLVADDQPVVREGLSMLLEAVDGFDVLGCPTGCEEMLREIRETLPDVVLLDMCVEGEDGVTMIQRIKLRHAGVGVLLFPSSISDDSLGRALACGVNGVILKNAPVPEVLEALTVVARGGSVLGPDLAGPSEASLFSRREREVLRLMAAGLNNREIGRSLFISLGTTKSHVESIARKMGTSHRAAAVAEAFRRGLVA
jgi:DNA-binding NarL/FixJ family response regulator